MFGFAIVFEPAGEFWAICGKFTVHRIGDRYLGDVIR